MNQELILWVLAQTFVYAGVVVLGYIKLTTRITRLETIMEILGDKAAKILHSPHTPDLDRLLEKYCDKYYLLTVAEWQELLTRCDEIENNLANPKDQRALAAIVGAMCHHKLMHPPPKPRKHEDAV